MEKEGIFQDDLAKLLLVHWATISKWERGASFCNKKYGKQIAKVFEVEDYMDFYVLKEDAYTFIMGQEIPVRYAQDFKKENLLIIDEDGNAVLDENGKLLWYEEGVRKLAEFKVLKLYHYYLNAEA